MLKLKKQDSKQQNLYGSSSELLIGGAEFKTCVRQRTHVCKRMSVKLNIYIRDAPNVRQPKLFGRTPKEFFLLFSAEQFRLPW